MNVKHIEIISKELNIKAFQTENTIKLLLDKSTVPFISRYRKEMTGSLDEEVIGQINVLYSRLLDIDKRKEAILSAIEKQEKLTPELKAEIEATYDLVKLEDIYLPYKQKRKTRAVKAIEAGLEPLAKAIMKQSNDKFLQKISEYFNDQIKTEDEALQGARDIIAEWINENTTARNIVRNVFKQEAVISSKLVKGKEEEGEKYKDYFDFEESLKKCPSHRILAMMRADNEGILKVSVSPNQDKALAPLERFFIKAKNESSAQVEIAIIDSYKRLLKPSIETEFVNEAKELADATAISVFAKNLRNLLLSAPLGQKRTLALDPAYRTGCKVVCLSAQGELLKTETIYPHEPKNQVAESAKIIQELIKKYQIEAIAIGNGTASRETEDFVKKVVKPAENIGVFVVSENGASVYSASKIAREEFPDYDVTVRGSVSIGRRLMDPLAELVKIDPKSIGVGQYQHDVDQVKLKQSLDSVVESCVNLVGVDLNTASKHLLTYISGLGPVLAQNIVEFRQQNGAFKSRKELKKVPRLGPKVFEQAAGFLRISNADNPLDSSAVHPEMYPVVEQMAKELKVDVKTLISDKELQKKIDIHKFVSEKIGIPTLQDIQKELAKPALDPRDKLETFAFDDKIKSINDLSEGMVLDGIVNNVTNFGAFVDIGIKENGLVHISNITNKFISDPSEILSVAQKIKVKIISIDAARKRIALTMKDL